MAYSEHQAGRIRQRLSKSNLTEEKKMMGGLIFMVNQKMCVGLDIDKKTGLDRLMVRVGKAAHDILDGNRFCAFAFASPSVPEGEVPS